MSKNPNLKDVEELFKKGAEFSLTDAQYEKKTGATLPKNKNYLLNNSALSRWAQHYKYDLEVIEKRVILKPKKS